LDKEGACPSLSNLPLLIGQRRGGRLDKACPVWRLPTVYNYKDQRLREISLSAQRRDRTKFELVQSIGRPEFHLGAATEHIELVAYVPNFFKAILSINNVYEEK
jgi:hypothetical protein